MRGLARIVTLLMLLLMGMPAVACMLPGLEMTAEEKACCKEMADRCGEMGMDPSHGCCSHLQHHDNQFVQNRQSQSKTAAPPEAASPAAPQASSSLRELLAEAEQNNPEIAAAAHGWQAGTHVAQQVSALPDTQWMVQQFAVGSPRPFAGFSNS